MMKKIALGVFFVISLNLSGYANAEITSECTLKGNGDYQCNFDNKGNKKDRTCIRLMLGKKPNVMGITKFVESRMLRSLYQMLVKTEDARGLADIEIRQEEDLSKFLSEQKNAAASSGKKLDIYVKENMSTLSNQIFSHEQKGLSGEICSGIIEPNDLRERHGTVSFSGGQAENLAPIEACKTDDESTTPWQDVCSFTTVSPIELHNYVKNKIASAPNNK